MAATATAGLARLRAAVTVPRLWGLAVALFFGAMLAFYLWTAATSNSMAFDPVSSGYYGMLADALRHGHLALDIQPPQALLDLPDPYDPFTNEEFRSAGLQDLSLRNGHLYAYWGPTAAIVLFAPLQAVGIYVSQSLAVALFGFLGFVFSVAIARFLVRRFLPGTPRWAMAVACVALGFGNTIPFILRRPVTHEVAIACGLCFGMLGIWLLLMGWFGPRPSRRKLLAAGVALGLALMSRPTLGALAIIPLVLVIAAWRGRTWPPRLTGPRVLAALFGPLAVCAALLMAYNAARFGSPLEFGQKFQLRGGDNELRTVVPAFIPSGLYLYLLVPPRPTALFPFLRLDYPSLPWTPPAGFNYIEATGGALVLAPVLWWILVLPVLRRRAEPDLHRLLWAMVGSGGIIVLALSFLLPGTTQRYAVDFMALLTIPALLAWMVLLSRTRNARWRHRLVAISGFLAVAWGSAAGLAIGLVGYDNRLEVTHPALVHRLQDVFSPVSVLETRVAGRPVIGYVTSPYNQSATRKVAWGSLRQCCDLSFVVTPVPAIVTIVAPRTGIYHLRGVTGLGPDGVAGGGTIMTVQAGKAGGKTAVGGSARFDVPVRLKAGITRLAWTAAALRSAGPLLAIVEDLSIEGPD